MRSPKIIPAALLLCLCLSCDDSNGKNEETPEPCVPGCSGYKFTVCTEDGIADWKNCPNGCNDKGCIDSTTPAPACVEECINNLMFVSCTNNSRHVTQCPNGCNEKGCIQSECQPGCSSDNKSFTTCGDDGKADRKICEFGCDAQKGCLTEDDINFDPCPGDTEYFSVCDAKTDEPFTTFYRCFKRGDAWLLRAKHDLKCSDGCADDGKRCKGDIDDAYKPCTPNTWTNRCEDEHILTCNSDFHYVDVLNCRDKDSSSMHYICTSIEDELSCQPECAEDEDDGIKECSTDASGHDSLWLSGCFMDDHQRRYFAYEENITCEYTCDPEAPACTCPENAFWSFLERKCVTYPEPGCASDSDCANDEYCDKETSECQPKPEGCTKDSDCEDDEYCDKETSQCQPKPEGCTKDSDCEDDEYCDKDSSQCLIKPQTCTKDSDCEDDEYCEKETSQCQPKSRTCTKDSDCEDDEYCDKETSECTVTPNTCTKDSDCEDDEYCDEEVSECLPKPDPCTKDSDCEDDEYCDKKTSECLPKSDS